jgi:hypothetical protein
MRLAEPAQGKIATGTVGDMLKGESDIPQRRTPTVQLYQPYFFKQPPPRYASDHHLASAIAARARELRTPKAQQHQGQFQWNCEEGVELAPPKDFKFEKEQPSAP